MAFLNLEAAKKQAALQTPNFFTPMKTAAAPTVLSKQVTAPSFAGLSALPVSQGGAALKPSNSSAWGAGLTAVGPVSVQAPTWGSGLTAVAQNFFQPTAAPVPQPQPQAQPQAQPGRLGSTPSKSPVNDYSGGGPTIPGPTHDPSQPSTPTNTAKPGQPITAGTVRPTPIFAPMIDPTAAARMKNLAQPGTYEEWYANNKDRYNPATTELGDYWKGVEGKLTGQRFGTSYASDAYSPLYNSLSGQGAGGTNAQGLSQQLKGKSAGEGVMGQAASYFQQPGMSQTYAQNVQNSGYFQQPGQSEQYNQQVQGRLGQRGQGGVAAGNLLNQTNYGQGAIDATGRAIPEAQRTAQLYDSQFPGFNATNEVGAEGENFLPGLREKSNSENLYDSGNQGLNTFYDRERIKRQEALETKMAAMGVFGSGDTAKGLYEIEGELGAAQARDMAALAGQSDQARLGRSAEARSYATATGQEGVARMGLTADTAKASDANRVALLKSQLEAQGLASDEALAKAQQYSKLDEDELARLQLGGQLAGQADTQGRARYTDLADITQKGDASGLSRAQGLASTGASMSAAELARLQSSGDLGLRADQEARERASQQWGMSTDMEEQERAWRDKQLDAHRFERDTAAGVDNAEQARLTSGGAAAKTEQEMFQERERYSVTDSLAVAQAKGNMIMKLLEPADAEKFAAEIASINADLAAGKLTADQAQQQTANLYKLGENLVKGIAGGGGG